MGRSRIRLPRSLGEFAGFASSTVVVQTVRVATGLIAARVLGPVEWGEWYVLNLILAYGSLTHLGALSAMSRDVPAAMGRGNPVQAKRLASTSLGMTIAGGLCGAVVVTLLARLSVVRGELASVALVGALLVSQQAYNFVVAYLRAKVRFPSASRLQFALAGTYLSLGVGGVLAFALPGFILGILIAHVIAVGAGWRHLKDIGIALEGSVARQLIASGLPIMLVGVANTLFTTVDRWIVLLRLGQYELGLYSLAIMALNAMALLPQVVSQQVYPRIAFSWARSGSIHEIERLVRRQRLASQTLTLPLTVVAIIAFPPLVERFLPEYADAVPAISVTLLTPLVASFGQGYSATLHVLGRQGWYLSAVLFAAVLNVVLSLALVGPLGLVGVATATLVGNAALALLRILLGAIALRRAAMRPQGSEATNASMVGR